MPIPKDRKTRLAAGALSHIIGAYYLLGTLFGSGERDIQKDPLHRQMLLHIKGAYWTYMELKFDIKNPKREGKE